MRLYRISFVAGFAAGFVAGTRAGREKYDQMVRMAKAAAENSTVQQAAGTIQTQASTAAQKVGSQLHDKLPPIAHSAAHTVADRIHGLRHKDSSAADERAASNGYPFATTGNSQGTQSGGNT